MSISLASYTFGTLTTHQCVEAGPYDFQNMVGRFFGAVGETELRDEQKGRFLRLPAIWVGYNSKALLEAGLNAIEDQSNQLHGTLTVDGATWQNVTFLALERQGQPFYDGSGVNKWCHRGMLLFRQLQRNS